MPLFSIIVPIYNVENYMRECIDSILKQNFQDFELILVNDGSTDKSGVICDEYLERDKRIKVIHQSNGGASSARNTGLKKASGEYVYFIDSDDYLANYEAFEKINSIIKNDKNVDIIKTKQIAFKDKTDDFYKVYNYRDIGVINGQNGLDAMLLLCKTNQMVVSVYSYIIRRQILIDNEIYFIEGVYSEDINWVPRVFLVANKVNSLDEFIYCRRQERPGQVTYKTNLKRDLDCARIVDDWFRQKNILLVLNDNKNSKYFWNYLSNIYIGVVSNQYLYKGVESNLRMKELASYAYIIKYLNSGRNKRFNIIYKLFGFQVYVAMISFFKKTYRSFQRFSFAR